MRHIDIGGYIDIPYKKIGITGRGNATLTSRLRQISNTKSPIQAQCIAAWEHADASTLESAMHLLLDDNRIEGEWFYDKDDTLVERMKPMMKLLKAEEIEIKGAEDPYTRNILKNESDSKSASNQALLGEISAILSFPLRTSMRKTGPTFFSDKTDLTYYIGYRKSGKHSVSIGRSKEIFDELRTFLEGKGFGVEKHARGHATITGQPADLLAELINTTESEFIID